MKHFRADYNRIQDPINKIAEDEPVLLIRAKDICGPEAAEAYADIAERNGAASAFVETVRKGAEMMREWQSVNATKIPDMPAEASIFNG